MTKVVPAAYLGGGRSWCYEVASFAPGGREFVVVLRRGNIKENVNRYSMVLWNAARDPRLEHPKIVLEMSSSSTLRAIDPSSIVWGPAGTLTFLGAHLGAHHEVYQLSSRTGLVTALTHHDTDVIAYSRDADGAVMAYEALPPFESIWDGNAKRYGLIVTSQYLPDLMLGRKGYAFRGRIAESELFVQNSRGTRAIEPLRGSRFRSDVSGEDNGALAVSPDGRHAIVLETVSGMQLPASWRHYRSAAVQLDLSALGKVGGPRVGMTDSYLSRYVLVDLQTGRSGLLLNAPIPVPGRILWAPDSKRAVLSNVILPVDSKAPAPRYPIATVETTVEVDTQTGSLARVTGCGEPEEWRTGRDGLELVCDIDPVQPAHPKGHGLNGTVPPGTSEEQSQCVAPEESRLRKIKGKWQAGPKPESKKLEVFVKEGMNLPPSLYYQRQGERSGRTLYDLNPEFKDLQFATVRQIAWSSSSGHRMVAGLYYPPDYRPGVRYPLVIQTHGWDPERFWFFGPSTTAFAAQALAARDIFVLQVSDVTVPIFKDGAQRKEVEEAISIYSSAIKYLASTGLIDPRRVGIIGWSRTCFYVKWALAHDPRMFAAATVAEGEDGGYLQYITDGNSYVDAPSLYGGGPFGGHLNAWMALSPGFNLNRVDTPLLIQVLNPRFILGDWEWFDGLTDLGKPVEMVILDHDEHSLEKPWDRLVSAGGNVDWFDFWLNHGDDAIGRNEAQYVRWLQLRTARDGELQYKSKPRAPEEPPG